MTAAFKASVAIGVGTSSSTTLVCTTNGAIAVDDLVVVRVATDNLSATTPTLTCTDSGGNAYTRHYGGAVNATAAAGVAGAVFATKATAAVNVGGTITITLSGAVAHKACFVQSFTGVDNVLRSTAVSASGASTAAASPASGTVNAGDLVIGTVLFESRGAVTGDSDSLNGTWSGVSSQPSATSGSDASCVQAGGQFKIPNAAGAQTFNATIASTDWLASLIVFQATQDSAITQAAYGFYDDTGTESGAAALAAQDTAVTGNLANGDGFGSIRIRLQSTTAINVAATDDFALQYEKNASGSWLAATSGAVVGYNSATLTEGAATTNRLTGGTGTFTAGKVSEASDVTNLGWNGNNFTELLYSVRLVAAQFADGDVLRFRVVRNGGTTGMTYTSTPTINIVGTKTWSGSSATVGVAATSGTWSQTAYIPFPIALASGGTTTGSAPTVTSASATPPANKQMYAVLAFGNNAHTAAVNVVLTDTLGAGSTWTQLVLSAGAHGFGAGYNTYYGLYKRDAKTGSSPTAMTVTADPYLTGDNAWATLRVFTFSSDVDLVAGQIMTDSASGSGQAVTITLPGTPSASNVTLFMPGGNVDTPFISMDPIAGWTGEMNTPANAYAVISMFYRTGNTSASITETKIGTGANAHGGVMVEFAPTPSPIPTTGLVAWYDADDATTITASGGSVSQWADKSGMGPAVTQGTGTLQPTTGTRTINGRNALDFNDDVLTFSPYTVAQPVMAFVVVQADVTDAQNRQVIGHMLNNPTIYTTGNTWNIYNGSNLESFVPIDTSPHIVTGVWNGVPSEIRIDGVSVATANMGSNGWSASTLMIGGGNGGYFWDGLIAEVIIYDRALSAVEVTQVEKYLNTKWMAKPIPASGLVGWWDADDPRTFTYSSGVLASRWADKSGSNNHVVQATVGRQPSRNGSRAGRTTVVFDGARGMGVAPSAPVGALPNEAWTYFVVVIKTGAAMTFETVFCMVAGNQGRWWDAYNNARYGASVYNSTGASPDYRTAFSTLSVYRVRVRRGTPYAQLILLNEEAINGVVQRSTTAGDNTAWDTTGQELWIGARADFSTFLRGEIAEVVLYDRYLDNTETATVESYLTDKWIPAVGPGGKPKVWNGSAWVEKPLKVWNGSAWVEKPLKVWTGSAWVLA